MLKNLIILVLCLSATISIMPSSQSAGSGSFSSHASEKLTDNQKMKLLESIKLELLEQKKFIRKINFEIKCDEQIKISKKIKQKKKRSIDQSQINKK